MVMRKAIARMVIIIILCLFSVTQGMSQSSCGIKGKASYYARMFEGRRTATGEIFRHSRLTAASNRFKFGTLLKVTNAKNGKTVVVKINDRMGNKTRLIDLSAQAAKTLGFFGHGLTNVTVVTLME